MSKKKKPGSVFKKTFACNIKQIEEQPRTLRFVISDETLDRDNEILSVDGWDFEKFKKNPVFLWMHDSYSKPPLGTVPVIEANLETKQVFADVYFPSMQELTSAGTDTSDHAKFIDVVYNMYKGGYLNAVSVGFRPIDWEKEGDVKRFVAQELIELSACPIPANPNALQLAKDAGIDVEIIEKYWDISEKMSIIEEKIGRIEEKVNEIKLRQVKGDLPKSGRVLSAVNETKLRQAHDLLVEVLAAVEPEEEEAAIMAAEIKTLLDKI